jgi:hypothetical protein
MPRGCLARYPTNAKVLHSASAREARFSVLLLARSALAPGARKTFQPYARKYVEPKVLPQPDHVLRSRPDLRELTDSLRDTRRGVQAHAIFKTRERPSASESR